MLYPKQNVLNKTVQKFVILQGHAARGAYEKFRQDGCHKNAAEVIVVEKRPAGW